MPGTSSRAESPTGPLRWWEHFASMLSPKHDDAQRTTTHEGHEFDRVDKALRGTKVFLGLSPTQQQQCVDSMQVVLMPAQAVLCNAGDLCKYIYFIEDGECLCIEDGQAVRLGPDSLIGIEEIIYNKPHAGTVTCGRPTRLRCLDKLDYRRIVAEYADTGASDKMAKKWNSINWEKTEEMFKKSCDKGKDGQYTMGKQATYLCANPLSTPTMIT